MHRTRVQWLPGKYKAIAAFLIAKQEVDPLSSGIDPSLHCLIIFRGNVCGGWDIPSHDLSLHAATAMDAFPCSIVVGMQLDDHGNVFYSGYVRQRDIQSFAVRVPNCPRLAKYFWLLAAVLQVPLQKFCSLSNFFVDNSLQSHVSYL